MVFWICGALVFFLDRGTKYLVVKKLSLGQTSPVIEGFFHLIITVTARLFCWLTKDGSL